MEIRRDGQTSLATGASRERGIVVCGRGILVVAVKLNRVEVRFLFFACYVCDRIFVAVLSGFSGWNSSYCCRVIFHRVFKRRSEGRRGRVFPLSPRHENARSSNLLGGGGEGREYTFILCMCLAYVRVCGLNKLFVRGVFFWSRFHFFFFGRKNLRHCTALYCFLYVQLCSVAPVSPRLGIATVGLRLQRRRGERAAKEKSERTSICVCWGGWVSFGGWLGE